MVPGKFDRYKRYLKEKKKQENIAIKKRKPFYNPNLDKLSKSVKNLNYHDFLISRYWDEVRKIILIRDKNKCLICGAKYNLHVHHSSYPKRGTEHKNLDCLMSLCACCHKEYHYNIEGVSDFLNR